ncbi:MAG: hypothetical protein R3B96_14415 [Pirellulaceae bacterium]
MRQLPATTQKHHRRCQGSLHQHGRHGSPEQIESFESLNLAQACPNKTITVDTLTPPPVEHAPAPIIIKTIETTKVAGRIAVRSTVLKPAVRHETLWNAPATNRSIGLEVAKAPFHSNETVAAHPSEKKMA